MHRLPAGSLRFPTCIGNRQLLGTVSCGEVWRRGGTGDRELLRSLPNRVRYATTYAGWSESNANICAVAAR
jgi:hypothetical protein